MSNDWSGAITQSIDGYLEKHRRNFEILHMQALLEVHKTMESRGRRKKGRLDYRELADVRLPRATRRSHKATNDLFPVKIEERTDSRVKVHYVGYSSIYDEWKDISELETLREEQAEQQPVPCTPFQPFSLYKDLRLKIKLAMSCSRKASPSVRVSTSFDIVLFNGGLKQSGVPSRQVAGNQYYKIRHYCDLNPLLGSRWHYRGLNTNGDYCYAVLETIECCIRKGPSVMEYYPDNDNVSSSKLDTGYVVCFCFVCKYGNATTFGKDRNIFFE